MFHLPSVSSQPCAIAPSPLREHSLWNLHCSRHAYDPSMAVLVYEAHAVGFTESATKDLHSLNSCELYSFDAPRLLRCNSCDMRSVKSASVPRYHLRGILKHAQCAFLSTLLCCVLNPAALATCCWIFSLLSCDYTLYYVMYTYLSLLLLVSGVCWQCNQCGMLRSNQTLSPLCLCNPGKSLGLQVLCIVRYLTVPTSNETRSACSSLSSLLMTHWSLKGMQPDLLMHCEVRNDPVLS